MIVTEEEAKTKRCQESFGDGWTTPDGRLATMVGAPHGQAVVASPYFCIGSACMAWRWRGMRSNTERERVHDNSYTERAIANGTSIEGQTPVGRCGKAGPA